MAYDVTMFQQLSEELGDAYQAVNHIAAQARKLAESHNNVILHSEAINWVITGVKPDILEQVDKLPDKPNFFRSYVDEALAYVSDGPVRRSAKSSIFASKSARHLIYIYRDVSDPHRRARVRVLTRMVWYNLKLDKYQGGCS